MFIDFSVVSTKTCMTCFECTAGETASSWRLLDSGQVGMNVESTSLKVEEHFWILFSCPLETSTKMGFQPLWATKVSRDIGKIKRIWSSIQPFPSKTWWHLMRRRKTLPTSTSMTSSNNTPRALSRFTNLKIWVWPQSNMKSNTRSMCRIFNL